jgi:hypothetical protein
MFSPSRSSATIHHQTYVAAIWKPEYGEFFTPEELPSGFFGRIEFEFARVAAGTSDEDVEDHVGGDRVFGGGSDVRNDYRSSCSYWRGSERNQRRDAH